MIVGTTVFARETSETTESVRTLDTPRTIHSAGSALEWQKTASEIRTSILVNCGLQPLPPRTPLNLEVKGHLDRDGYTVENIVFQPLPGLYVGGNIYRPNGPKGTKYPGVLNPHGHWEQGRLEQTETLDAPARCAQFARMGMVALSFDMLGYQDTTQFSNPRPDPASEKPKFYEQHVKLFQQPELELWNLSLMGVQLWNSVRALDLLLSLPEVDPDRIGCTGESGGATQTFLLGAIDDRVQVAAPVNMVSHTMQGGCRCENAPGLRVEYSNLDFAAAFAPRPLLLVGATGDWTRDLLEVEAPAIRAVYQLFSATNRFRALRFPAPHNYNLASREAVYGWFGEWLLGQPSAERKAEILNPHEPRLHLKANLGDPLPPDALTETGFVQAWIAERRSALRRLKDLEPESGDYLRHLQSFDSTWWPAGKRRESGTLHANPWNFQPSKLGKKSRGTVIIVESDGTAGAKIGEESTIRGGPFEDSGYSVMTLRPYPTAERRQTNAVVRSPFTNFFSTYNPSILQRRVGDIRTACEWARQQTPTKPVILIGRKAAGLWCLLAAPAASAVVADCSSIPLENDSRWLSPELFIPGFNLFGGFNSSLAMAYHRMGTGEWRSIRNGPIWLYSPGPQLKKEIDQRSAFIAKNSLEASITEFEPDDSTVIKWIKIHSGPAPSP